MTRWSRSRSRPVRAAAGVLIAGAVALVVWQGWQGGYDVTSTYGGLGGGWLQFLVLFAVVAGLLLAAVVALVLRFLGVRRTLRWAAPAGVVICLASTFAGAYFGRLQAEEDARLTATSCRGGVSARMVSFAEAARPENASDVLVPRGTPDGCRVEITIPGSTKAPFEYVDRRVSQAGFSRTGQASWTDGHGLTVTMRLDRFREANQILVFFTGVRTGSDAA